MTKFETEHRVGYAETDAMAIVHHSNYIRWFEIGRNELLRSIGYPYSMLEKIGVWMPAIGVSCQYKTPAVFDEVVVIRSWIEKLKGASVYLGYEVVNKETQQVHVTGMSSHGFTDPDLVPLRLKKSFPDLYAQMSETVK
ncbi:MAG: thioesterase family protein [Anaerovoracaceae bacterium]